MCLRKIRYTEKVKFYIIIIIIIIIIINIIIIHQRYKKYNICRSTQSIIIDIIVHYTVANPAEENKFLFAGPG